MLDLIIAVTALLFPLILALVILVICEHGDGAPRFTVDLTTNKIRRHPR